MNSKDIIAGNKLIYEFMGWNHDSVRTQKYEQEVVSKDDEWLFPNQLQYNNDWNLLMPIVEKIINELKFDFSLTNTVVVFYLFRTFKTGCTFPSKTPHRKGTEGTMTYLYMGSENRLDAIFKTVVEVIKYINSANKKPNQKLSSFNKKLKKALDHKPKVKSKK